MGVIADWQRTLWESSYLRVRRENEPMAAAQIVVRFLRERVGISRACRTALDGAAGGTMQEKMREQEKRELHFMKLPQKRNMGRVLDGKSRASEN